MTANDGALIALSVEGELIGVAEGTGSPVSVTIDAQIPPTNVDIVVTMQNYYRYEAVITVIPPSGPYVVFDSYVLNDPTGNQNGMLDYGETANLDMTLHNVGSDEATNVVTTITSNDPYITIIDGTENFGNINANSTISITEAFQIEVAGDVPNGHVINFVLTADGDDVWESYFSIEALAPVVEFMEFLVDDTIAGNGDYLWDPGEEVDIIVTLENIGSSTAFNVVGGLTSSDAFVTMNTTSTQSYGDITNGANQSAVFNATSDENTPEAHLAQFVIDFIADLGITGSGMFESQIGGYLIEEYFENWLPTGWTTDGGSNWIHGTGNNAGGTAPEAEFYWSPSTNAVQRLVSKPVNTTGSSSLNLSFMQTVNDYNGNYTIRLETTSDGLTWNAVTTFPSSSFGPQLEEIEITTPDVGSPTFQIAWTFDGDSFNINYWYVDNVILGGGTTAILGTVSGVVTDADSGSPVAGAEIGGLAISGADGSYTLDIAIGTYDLTCTADNYFDLTIEDLEVEEGVVTSADFALNSSFPPSNVEAEIADYNDVVITWAIPVVLENENVAIDRISNLEGVKNTSGTREIPIKNNEPLDESRALTGFKIYKDGTEIEEITDPGILTYTDAAIDAGEYEYEVTAIYEAGESDPSSSSEVTITLPAPADVTAQSQEPNIIISWSIPTTRSIVSYSVYRDNEVIAEDIMTSPYEDLDVPTANYIYNVVTVYDGGWESEMSNNAFVMHTDANELLKPVSTELTGNYPNPFNPTTTISFSTKEAGFVSINIYNMKGQLVKKLVEGNLEAAYHNVLWNGMDDSNKTVSSGIYFYKMKTTDYTATQKMILMK